MERMTLSFKKGFPKKPSVTKRFQALFLGKHSISERFRNINIMLLVITSMTMVMAMLGVIKDVSERVSLDYARLYTTNAAGSLGAHLNKDIGLIGKAARSSAVREWFADDENPEKKISAHEEMLGVLSALYSDNLYIGVEKTRHEYPLGEDHTVDDIVPRAKLNPENHDDVWYFDCLASDKDYVLNVDIDKILHRRCVWLNYKVSQDGVPLGVLSAGLEFSAVAAELFAEYDNTKVHSVVIDEAGIIQMDSDMLGNEGFLNIKHDPIKIDQISSDPNFLATVEAYLGGINGYFELRAKPLAVEISTGQYSYATIAPIVSTSWSVVTFYKSSSLFDPMRFLPFFMLMIILFVVFIMVITISSRRLILVPFEKLIKSLLRVRENNEKTLYGTEREDEFGILSNTIQDLFIKAHYDELTGIYNRRFLEKDQQRLIDSMSRYAGVLSVLMIDVDFFKKYNDRYGHEMGDVCLRSVAQTLAHSLKRPDDFVVRYGGEEFAAILPNTDAGGACVLAGEMLAAVSALNMPHEANAEAGRRVTVSIGIATGTVTYTQGLHEYLNRADEALYMSKQDGRNRYTHLAFGS